MINTRFSTEIVLWFILIRDRGYSGHTFLQRRVSVCMRMCDRMCVLKHLFSLIVAVYVSKILSVPVRGRPTCWRSNHELKMLYIIYTLNLVTVFLLQDLCILSSDVWLYLFQWNMLLFVIANWMRLYICKWSTLFKEMQIIFFFFFCLIAILSEVTSVSSVFGQIQLLARCQRCSRSHKRPPLLQRQPLPLPLGPEKGSLCRQGASQERSGSS